MTTASDTAPARTLRARAGSLFLAENKRNFWAIDLPAETIREDLERPAFWSHDAAKMKAGDRVEARWEDGQKWADLLVVSSNPGAVRMHVIHFMEQGEAASDEPGGDLVLVEVKWRGPTAKWSVVRVADAMLIKEGFADKIDALRHAAQYEKTITR